MVSNKGETHGNETQLGSYARSWDQKKYNTRSFPQNKLHTHTYTFTRTYTHTDTHTALKDINGTINNF